MTATARRSILVLVLVLGVLAASLVVGGCGLSADSGPQAIAPKNLPPNLLDPNPGSSTTTAESPGSSTVRVYFVRRLGDRDHLAEVDRVVADDTIPGDRIAALLAQPTEAEADRGLTSSIPADTVLLDASLDDSRNELVVNLSNELFSIQGEELAKAFAQIVWTVTELDDIRQVRFLVDGAAIRAQDAAGVEQRGAVTRADYAALAPS